MSGSPQCCLMCQSVGTSGIASACVMYRLTFTLLKYCVCRRTLLSVGKVNRFKLFPLALGWASFAAMNHGGEGVMTLPVS